MGLLDDLVKLQFGAPMREGLGAIGQGIREKKAEETMIPIIQQFAKEYQDPTNIPTIQSTTDPSQRILDVESIQKRLASALSSGGRMTPSLMDTQAYKSAKENITSISDAILKGASVKSGLEVNIANVKESVAKAGDLNAKTAEQLSDTKFMNESRVPGNAEWAPKSMYNRTYREYLQFSKATTPFVNFGVESMRLGIATREQMKPIQEFKNTFLIPALGGESSFLKGNIDNKILENDIDGIVKGLIKGGSQKSYPELLSMVSKAYANKSRDAMAQSNLSYSVIQARAEAMYKDLLDSLPPGTPPPPHDLYIFSKMQEMAKMTGNTDFKQLSGLAQEAEEARKASGVIPAPVVSPTSTGSPMPSNFSVGVESFLNSILPPGVFNSKPKLGDKLFKPVK